MNRYNLGKRLLPVKTNQKTDEYLKEIVTLCEIEENLTFHMARHTFATTITLSNNVLIETVSKMLGHSDLKTTQIYAKVVDEKMKSDMNALRLRMIEQV
ncbi:tyrosine-type recombinase/integrase [Labilibaculum antarcticum]|nr:tyrosine-type recombinase/integrase [Labilibaculum antarcticum]